METDSKYKKGHFIGLGMAIGLPTGVPVGLVIGNITLGFAISLSLSIGLGIILEKKYNTNNQDYSFEEHGKPIFTSLLLIGAGLFMFVVLTLVNFL